MVESFVAVLWADGPSLRIEAMNGTAERLFGPLIGRPIRDVGEERGVGWSVDMMDRAIALGHALEYEAEWLGTCLSVSLVPTTTGISCTVTGPSPALPELEAARLALAAEGADGPQQQRRYRWGRLVPAEPSTVREAA